MEVILGSFGLFYGHLVYFVVIWYIFLVLVCCIQKNLATLDLIHKIYSWQYENFLQKHPDGKIRKKDFRLMMQTCYPNTDTEKLEKHIFRLSLNC
jgi:hypothetical protein